MGREALAAPHRPRPPRPVRRHAKAAHAHRPRLSTAAHRAGARPAHARARRRAPTPRSPWPQSASPALPWPRSLVACRRGPRPRRRSRARRPPTAAARALAACLGHDARRPATPSGSDLPLEPHKADPDDAVVGRALPGRRAHRSAARPLPRGGLGPRRCCAACPAPRARGTSQSSTLCRRATEVPFEDVPALASWAWATTADGEAARRPGALPRARRRRRRLARSRATSPVRLEFFGDEIDRVRRMVPSDRARPSATLQRGDASTPCRELALTDDDGAPGLRARPLPARPARAPRIAALTSSSCRRPAAAHARARPLPAAPLRAPPPPRSSTWPPTPSSSSRSRAPLFDDCMRATDEDLARLATGAARVARLDGLYAPPRELDFGQPASASTTLSLDQRAGGGRQPLELEVRAARHRRVGRASFIARVRQLRRRPLRRGLCRARPRRARGARAAASTDESVPFAEPPGRARERGRGGRGQVTVTLRKRDADRLDARPIEDRSDGTRPQMTRTVPTLTRGRVTFIVWHSRRAWWCPRRTSPCFSVADLNVPARRPPRPPRPPPRGPHRGDLPVQARRLRRSRHARHRALHRPLSARRWRGKRAGLLPPGVRGRATSSTSPSSRSTASRAMWDPTARSASPHAPQHRGLERAPRARRGKLGEEARLRPRRPLHAPELRRRATRLLARHPRPAGDGGELPLRASRPTSSLPSHDIKARHGGAPVRWTACSAATWASARPRSPCARRSSAARTAKQVMVLCPTTILAQQHFETFFSRFAPFDLRRGRAQPLCAPPPSSVVPSSGFADGSVDVLIGTHRLLSADVNPYDLGLVDRSTRSSALACSTRSSSRTCASRSTC